MSGLDHELEALEVGPRPPPRPPAGPDRRARGPVAVGLVVAVVLVAMTAVARDRWRGSDASPASVDEAARGVRSPVAGGAPGDEAAPPGWRRGDPGPIPSRDGQVVVWTGSELLVWGGDPAGEGAPEGAAYHRDDDRWRALTPAPFPVRTQAVAAWTGVEMLIWGGQEPGPKATATGGAYSPLADRWRTLAPSPLAARVPLVGVWTGAELVIAGGTADGRRDASPEAAAYDPAADAWRTLPAMPVALTDAVGLWTGSEVVVVGAALDRDNASLDPDGRPRAAAYDPVRNRWRMLPPLPLSPQAVTAVWGGDRVVAWDYELHAVALVPSTGPHARWYGLPDLPLGIADCSPKGAGGRGPGVRGVPGEFTVFAEHCGQGAVYRPSTGDWTRLPHPRQLDAQPVWTGDELLFWVGRFVGSADGLWRFRPP